MVTTDGNIDASPGGGSKQSNPSIEIQGLTHGRSRRKFRTGGPGDLLGEDPHLDSTEEEEDETTTTTTTNFTPPGGGGGGPEAPTRGTSLSSSPLQCGGGPPPSTMMMNRNVHDQGHFLGDFSLEDSPSYDILNTHNMLTKKYRVASEKELLLTPPNSTREFNTMMNMLCCCCGDLLFKGFEVPSGTIKTAYDGRGEYKFFGPGVHRVLDPYYKVSKNVVALTVPKIVYGDTYIITVQQGYIGYCMERGQPVLLPPGMHQWSCPTLEFIKLIDLHEPVIELGPWTLLTIDQGYMAVTQDNGKQVILDGGSVYLLTHRNWKFEKFVSTKIQTDELKRIEAASADNVIMLVDATVLWKISDVETAVRMSAETMNAKGAKTSTNIVKLRNDVLKQAEASLAFFVGTINFSDSMAAAAKVQRSKENHTSHNAVPAEAVPEYYDSTTTNGNDEDVNGQQRVVTADLEFNLYNNNKLDDAVSHANEITQTYGVEIISINIISAIPADKKLQESLAAGAVAAAEAQMMETTAQGKSRAMQIEAKAKAEEITVLARADADADIVCAQGAQKAADILATNPVSVELAKIDRTGLALSGGKDGGGSHSSSFFFGANPGDVQSLLANPNVIKGNPLSHQEQHSVGRF